MCDWLEPHGQLCLVEKGQEIRTEPRAGLMYGAWLTRWTVFLVKQKTHRNMDVT